MDTLSGEIKRYQSMYAKNNNYNFEITIGNSLGKYILTFDSEFFISSETVPEITSTPPTAKEMHNKYTKIALMVKKKMAFPRSKIQLVL